MVVLAEYLWIDGYTPTPHIRSKTKVLSIDKVPEKLDDSIPVWGFDGSSTKQAEGGSSDCVLKPVRMYKDPFRPEGNNILVLNEVLLPNMEPHPSNTRHALAKLAEKYAEHEFWFGIEQEYTLMKDKHPFGFPPGAAPLEAQGKYYCGAGAGKVFGRDLAEEHLRLSLLAGVKIAGINAEVMPGQWEYQVGHAGPLKTADDLTVARYIMNRIGEIHGIDVSLDPKPIIGDWNGAGDHTNFSNKGMRDGSIPLDSVISKLGARHQEHIAVYGEGNRERLTGLHETCSIDEFRAGVSDRGASVRIPWQVARDGKGYLEDRRPAANMDPYKVLGMIMETVVN